MTEQWTNDVGAAGTASPVSDGPVSEGPVSDGPVSEGPVSEGADPSDALLEAGRRLVNRSGPSFTSQELIQEAGVALQTFYRCFGGKDQFTIALLSDILRRHCARLEATQADVEDPIAKLRAYLQLTLASRTSPERLAAIQFVTSEHWRLQALFPEQVAESVAPMAELFRVELAAADRLGLATLRSPERDAWLMTKLVLSVHHDFAFRAETTSFDGIEDDVATFCLSAVGLSIDD